ncbi:MAG: carbohydrate kinase family protein [Acidobacteriaceae bacterium]
MTTFTIVGVGEILWDVFPTHKQLGGAPANFAYISLLLGDQAIVATRIGNDELGDEVIGRLQALGLGTSYVQHDPRHPTGTVKVEVARDGQPRFEIVHPVAWDFLEWTPELESLAKRADAICFGSLAQRGPQSRETIHRFLNSTRKDTVRIFDVNLRQAFFSAEVLAFSAQKADILKVNHEELPIVVDALSGPPLDDVRSAQWLCRRFDLDLACITRGASGSILVKPSGHHEHPGYKVIVTDTVGSGDAFTATLIHHYLRGSSLEVMNDAANRMGAWVASKAGATPAADPAELEKARAQPTHSTSPAPRP